MGWTDPEKKAKNHEKYRLQYHRRMRWINLIKVKIGCEQCGYDKHPAALDFDHREPAEKEFLIPRYVGRSNLKRLFREIRKCRVLCANCHRVHSRTQWEAGTTRRKGELVGV